MGTNTGKVTLRFLIIKIKTDLTSTLLIKCTNDLIMAELLIKSLVIVHHNNKPKDSEILTHLSFS